MSRARRGIVAGIDGVRLDILHRVPSPASTRWPSHGHRLTEAAGCRVPAVPTAAPIAPAPGRRVRAHLTALLREWGPEDRV
ncbi:hypothetical protein [Streptomyces parvus]|uniref:hypothetical protein n=1 Tax=Streptomyces parvus TaxID=66428 RepID=UPI00381700B8